MPHRWRLFALAAIMLAGCRWGATSALIAGGNADPSPLAVGEYAWASDTQYYYSVQGEGSGQIAAIYHGSEGATLYMVQFDQLDSEFYLVEAEDSYEGGISYGLIRVKPRGFDQVNLSCSIYSDGPVAMAAGAAYGENDECMFTSYNTLRRAAQAVAAEVRSNPAAYTVTSYLMRARAGGAP